jgi:hypothetical protein
LSYIVLMEYEQRKAYVNFFHLHGIDGGEILLVRNIYEKCSDLGFIPEPDIVFALLDNYGIGDGEKRGVNTIKVWSDVKIIYGGLQDNYREIQSGIELRKMLYTKSLKER